MTTNRQIVATYDYESYPECHLLYQVVRFAPKDFRQRRPAVAGRRPQSDDEWVWNLDGVTPSLYRLPELMCADENQPVLIPEGEKDVETLRSLGFVATCNSGGAGRFSRDVACWLRGRRVVVIPDDDEAGRHHAAVVAGSCLCEEAASVRVVEFPLWWPPKVKDVTDWMEKHHASADRAFRRQRVIQLVREGSAEYVAGPKEAA
jgi:hypothetical protein